MTRPSPLLTIVLLCFVLCGSVAAQQETERVYRPNPADEDWSFLKDPSRKNDFWDPVKYIRLGREDWFVTLSGEMRYRPEGFRIRGSGDLPSTIDNYFLQRYLFGADLHLGTQVRLFGELQAGVINGRLGSPRPTDRNTLDVHQAFIEIRPRLETDRRFVVWFGRQELTIGSSRLISASPGLNVKRSFDGIVASYRHGEWALVAAGARLVGIVKGTFDDPWFDGQDFWGVAASHRSPVLRGTRAGIHYLGLRRDSCATHRLLMRSCGTASA